MDRAIRSILWILIVLVFLSSFSAGWFFVAKERLYDKYVDLEGMFKTSMERFNRELTVSKKENRDLKSKLDMIKRKLDTSESKNKTLKERCQRFSKEKDDLNKDIARLKKGKFLLENQLKEIKSDNFMAGLLREKVSLDVELKRLKASLAPKDLEIEKLKRDIIDLTNKISEIASEKKVIEAKLKDTSEVAAILSRDLLQERDKKGRDKVVLDNINRENSIIKDKLSERERLIDKLFAQKKSMEVKIASLEKEIDYKKQENDRLKLSLKERMQYEEGARQEAYHTPNEVNLPSIVLEKQDKGADRFTTSPIETITKVKPSLKGRVVTVNREHNFVIIDLGKEKGVDVGTRLDVYRDNLLIGLVEVIQAREKISAVDIKDVRRGFEIEIDDVVVKR